MKYNVYQPAKPPYFDREYDDQSSELLESGYSSFSDKAIDGTG